MNRILIAVVVALLASLGMIGIASARISQVSSRSGAGAARNTMRETRVWLLDDLNAHSSFTGTGAGGAKSAGVTFGLGGMAQAQPQPTAAPATEPTVVPTPTVLIINSPTSPDGPTPVDDGGAAVGRQIALVTLIVTFVGVAAAVLLTRRRGGQ